MCYKTAFLTACERQTPLVVLPGKPCPAKPSCAEGSRMSQTPAREPRQHRYLGSIPCTHEVCILDTQDIQQVTRTTSDLCGRSSMPWPRTIFRQCSSSVEPECSLFGLTASKVERNHQHPWLSLCFSLSITYQTIKMKSFVYFKMFFPIFPSLTDPIRNSCLKSQSRIQFLQYVMTFI